MNYLKVLASLPVPTAEQTSQFADHVAQNHSWYKHLPFFPPGASCVVFPNPQAGKALRKDGEKFIVSDVETGNYFQHHSRLSTEEYRTRFGFWDYWVDDNPRVTFEIEGPWIYGLEPQSITLFPSELKRKWSCRLTAFLKPMPNMLAMSAQHFSRESQAFAASVQDRQGDQYARYQFLLGQQPLPGERANSQVLGFINDEAQIQRDLLLETLVRVREDWSEAS